MEKKMFNGHAFMREVYLRSNPSVDIEKVTAEHSIDCTKHKLPMSVYKTILREFGIFDENNKTVLHKESLLVGCNMWMLNKGPQLVDERDIA
jgi:hypothetical protein